MMLLCEKKAIFALKKGKKNFFKSKIFLTSKIKKINFYIL